MLRRIGVLASLAIVATMFASVSAAQAQTAGVCVFEGLTGNLTPAIEGAVEDATTGPDGTAALPLVDIEQGSYTFQTGSTAGAICAGLEGGAPFITNPANPATINSAGNYDNIVCGTGFAHDLNGDGTSINGQDLLSGRTVSLGGPADPAGYEIAFAGGVGALRIGPGGTPSIVGAAAAAYSAVGVLGTWTAPSGHEAHGNLVSNYTGAGVVQITPDPFPAANCVTTAAPDFQVKGAFVAQNIVP